MKTTCWQRDNFKATQIENTFNQDLLTMMGLLPLSGMPE